MGITKTKRFQDYVSGFDHSWTAAELQGEIPYLHSKANAHMTLHEYDDAQFYLEVIGWIHIEILFRTVSPN